MVAALAFGVHKVVTHHNGTTRTQTTVLLQIAGLEPDSRGERPARPDPPPRPGVEVLVPSRVITDVCGYGSQNFGDVLALPNGVPPRSRRCRRCSTASPIDGSWVLTPAQLAKLIDVFGGVTVDVDVNVVRHAGQRRNARCSSRPVRTSKLNGTQAVEYALYNTSPTADAAAAAGPDELVVDAMLQALPSNRQRRSRRTCASSAPGGTSTLGCAPG